MHSHLGMLYFLDELTFKKIICNIYLYLVIVPVLKSTLCDSNVVILVIPIFL